ncbi:MAG TPA: SDR family oxidoreductase [Solirubrobacterales bacterium]|nr:SDR family oxidoreductase [Solirubrobacterales bacterium]
MDVVIAGAHGKIARRLTRLLAGRGDRVRGLIRDPGHADDLRADGAEPVVCDLEGATTDELAQAIAGADTVVFAAGAGPGSGAERKGSMDRDGAVKLLEAAVAAGVDGYLMVSSIGADDPPGGDDVFSAYLRAKAEADQALIASDRTWTIVRPVSLTDDPGSGTVEISADPVSGKVSRDDVAAVLAAALQEPRTAQQIMYLRSGDSSVAEALKRFLADSA